MIFLEKVKVSSMRILPYKEDGQAATLTYLLPELSSRQNKLKSRHITNTNTHKLMRTYLCMKQKSMGGERGREKG